jgi:hypothetical protein
MVRLGISDNSKNYLGFALTNHIIFFYRFITYEYAKAHYKQPRNQSKRRLQAIENKE